MDSNPAIPDRTQAILHGGEDPVPFMIDTAQVLERAGADLLAVPCNSAHYYLNAIRNAVRIPPGHDQ
ncbi:aspartate/glutamate racemase family protein [Candidatus Bipolaricaulota bacterium]|nr:aspartate/glutamate racemase family protein [Candidatus Bipolaricaulota bacterium]